MKDKTVHFSEQKTTVAKNLYDSSINSRTMERVLPPRYQLFEYQIEIVLGEGGFGITYLAKDTHLNTKVAIKEYFPDSIGSRTAQGRIVSNHQDQELYQWGLDNFLREAQTLASFKHPNIVRVLRFFELNNTAYMVMEYEQGKSLSNYVMNQDRLTESKIIEMFIPLFKGLELIHQQNFLHRDIKPDNILVRDDESLVLLDFGSARQATDEHDQDNGYTTIISPGYAPLEQYDRYGHQGVWSDIYALGGVLYWLVSQVRPEQSLNRMANDSLIPAEKIAKGQFSKQFLQAIDWALAVQANNRPQSLNQFIKAITGEAIDLSSHRLDSQPDISYQPAKKNHWLIISLIGILVLSAGGYAFWDARWLSFINQIAPRILAETGNITWERTWGGGSNDKMISLEILDDGGSISVGWTQSEGVGGTDIVVVKLDNNGKLIWQRTYGGKGNDRPEDLKVLADGSGMIISGDTTSQGHGGADIWIFKINHKGDMLWQNIYGGAYDDIPGDIQALANGNFLIAAYTQSKGEGSEDIWLFESNVQGEIIWEKTFGGPMSDIPDDLKVLEEGSLLMTGWEDSKGSGGYDAWIIKLDQEGHKIWGHHYGGAGDDLIETMQVVSDGILLAGRTDSKGSGGGTDAWLMKINKEGELLWEKTYGWDKYDDFRDIEELDNGRFVISGITHSIGQGSSDIWLLNVDAEGEIGWIRTFGGSNREDFKDFEISSDGREGLIFAASTRSKGAGGWDGWIFRTEIKPSKSVDNY